MVPALLPHHSDMNDSPRYRPERDQRVRAPRRFLHDKLREAEAMIALWERSREAGRAPDAAEQWHYWRRKRFDILQLIARLDLPDE